MLIVTSISVVRDHSLIVTQDSNSGDKANKSDNENYKALYWLYLHQHFYSIIGRG